jgi:hypothetical protein
VISVEFARARRDWGGVQHRAVREPGALVLHDRPEMVEFGEFLLAEWEYSAKKPGSAQ